MKFFRIILVFLVVLCVSYKSVASENNIPEEMLSHMPIKEVTVFKDGHAFVLHSGKLDVNEEGHIVIVAGFQGVSEEENITTLGRGGSDLSAVALASVLNAEVCEIYTDVEGVFTV